MEITRNLSLVVTGGVAVLDAMTVYVAERLSPWDHQFPSISGCPAGTVDPPYPSYALNPPDILAQETIRRVLSVSSGCHVNLEGVTITGGYLRSDAPEGLGGAGIRNNGVLGMVRCSVIRNQADGMRGVGILNTGTLILTECTVASNLGTELGVAIYNQDGARLEMQSCSVYDNRHPDTPTDKEGMFCFRPVGCGTTLHNELRGTAIVKDSIVRDNRVNGMDRGHTDNCLGGKIAAFVNLGTATIINTTISSTVAAVEEPPPLWQSVSRAPRANLMSGEAASLTYILPAPLGSYLDGVFRCTVIMCMGPAGLQPCDTGQICDYASFEDRFISRLPQNYDSGEGGIQFPTPCYAGFVGNTTATRAQSSGFCTAPCDAGHWCGPAAVQPSPCPAGTAAPIGSTTEEACKPCDAGNFAERRGTALCKLCPAGSFQSASGGTACESCPSGSACARGAMSPTACSAGAHAPQPAQGSCTACPVGR